MSENAQTGLVGFFDILGYQNILERNEPEIIAQEVLPILTGIGKKVTDQIKEMATGINKDDSLAINAILDTMNWLVFSDTILLTLPVDTSEPINKSRQWIVFFAATSILQTELFDAGLPARGAIDYGRFFVKDTCFAGRTIIEAYKLCSKLELSACVLSNDVTKEFGTLNSELQKRIEKLFIIEYLIPMKDCEQHAMTVKAPILDKQQLTEIHTTVMHSFWGNKKDIPLSARQKAINTEQWSEFLSHRKQADEGRKENTISPPKTRRRSRVYTFKNRPKSLTEEDIAVVEGKVGNKNLPSLIRRGWGWLGKGSGRRCLIVMVIESITVLS